MATDREVEFKGPCKCGSGQFVVCYCTPGHSWPTSTPYWYECRITCHSCGRRYELTQRGRRFVLVEKSDLRIREEKREKAELLSSELMGSDPVRSLLERLTDTLEGQPSMAAIHRVLTGVSLEHSSIGTFRRHWVGAENWVQRNVSVHDLGKIMELLSRQDGTITSCVVQIDQLLDDSKQPPTPVDAIYRTARGVAGLDDHE